VLEAGSHPSAKFTPARAITGASITGAGRRGKSLLLSLDDGRELVAIKTQLLSQRPVAGVGNIYADEALWLAEINPVRRSLSLERAGRLLETVQSVMSQGIELGGTTLRDYRNADGGTGDNQHALAAYGRAGEPCLRCGETLRSRVIDARTTVWCVTCQRH